MLAKLNPFRGLPNPREVWAWGMYDLANQSFTLLINTMFFAVYFREVIVGSKAPGLSEAQRAAVGNRASLLWGATVAVSMLAVVILSPPLGAAADARGLKKRILILSGVGCGALTMGFGLVGPGDVALGVALYVGANILYQLGENFLAAFLPEISTRRNIGRISATGWTMGYAGALALLVLSLVWIKVGPLPTSADWRPLLVFAGAWFLVGLLPGAIVLREAAPDSAGGGGHPVFEGFRRVRRTLRQASEYRQLARFLIAFFIYGFGVQAVIFWAGVIAKDVVFAHLPEEQATLRLVLFIAQLTITAGIAAVVVGRVQDRVGARLTVLVTLGVWMASALGFFALLAWASRTGAAPPEWLFWMIGNGIGLGLGAIGTSSRSLMGRLTPAHRTAEFFGLWGMTYKAAGIIGPPAFGVAIAGFGRPAAMLLLAAFFVAGFILLRRVNELAGVCAARRMERRWRRESAHSPPAQLGGDFIAG